MFQKSGVPGKGSLPSDRKRRGAKAGERTAQAVFDLSPDGGRVLAFQAFRSASPSGRRTRMERGKLSRGFVSTGTAGLMIGTDG